jgi:glycosyl transferase family 25
MIGGNLVRNLKLHAAVLRHGPAQAARSTIQRTALDIPIFVINLERNQERRVFMTRYLASIGLDARVFPATDGRTLDLIELERAGVYIDSIARERFSRSLSPAEIGCALSHLRLYQTLIDEGVGEAVVLEDDAMLSHDFPAQLATLRGELPPDWDLVQLFCSCRDGDRVGPHVIRFLSRSCMPAASAGYLLRLSGAIKLVREGYPVRYPSDSLIGRSPRWGTNIYGTEPQLVSINNVFPSQIGHGHSLRTKVTDSIKRALVKVLK